jgi:hypothetical protein
VAAAAVAFLLFLAGGAVIYLWLDGQRALLSLHPPITRTAGEFLQSLGEGNISHAYLQTTAEFRARVDEGEFERQARELELHRFSSVVWEKPVVTKTRADLSGTVTTTEGAALTLTLTLRREGEDWHIASFSGQRLGPPPPKDSSPGPSDAGPQPSSANTAGDAVISDLAPDHVNLDDLDRPLIETANTLSGPDQVPPPETLIKLALHTILMLNQAILDRDFTAFHAFVSTPLQNETTPEGLKQAFHDFIAKNIDMSDVKDVPPVFDEPAYLDGKGRLNLYGHFPVRPVVRFDLKYVWEEGEWKLHAINVRRLATGEEDSPGHRAPSGRELNRLAHDTIKALDAAVKSGDFKDFYDGIALLWQEETTPEKLREAFQVFVDRQDLDLGAIDGLEPVFEPEPALDENGRLNLSGYYSTEPYPLHFQLGFVYEDNDWKLVRINVNM